MSNRTKTELIGAHHISNYHAMLLNFKQWQKEKIKFEKAQKKKNPTKKEMENALEFSKNSRAGKLGTVIFGGLTLESFINFYGKVKKIRDINTLQEHLKTVDKFRIYPYMVTGKYFDKEKLKNVERVFKLRNQLVHPKPKFSSEKKNQTNFSLKNGNRFINIIHEIVRELGNHEINSNWIHEDIKDKKEEWTNKVVI